MQNQCRYVCACQWCEELKLVLLVPPENWRLQRGVCCIGGHLEYTSKIDAKIDANRARYLPRHIDSNSTFQGKHTMRTLKNTMPSTGLHVEWCFLRMRMVLFSVFMVCTNRFPILILLIILNSSSPNRGPPRNRETHEY